MGVTVKLPAAVAVPPAVLTDTVPVTAPGITKPTKVSPVLDTTMVLAPPTVRVSVAVPRLVPVMVIKVPMAPVAGEKEEMVGAWANKLKVCKVIKMKVIKTTAAGFRVCVFMVYEFIKF